MEAAQYVVTPPISLKTQILKLVTAFISECVPFFFPFFFLFVFFFIFYLFLFLVQSYLGIRSNRQNARVERKREEMSHKLKVLATFVVLRSPEAFFC